MAMVTVDAGEARKQGRAGAATPHKQEGRVSTPSSRYISSEYGQEAREADSGGQEASWRKSPLHQGLKGTQFRWGWDTSKAVGRGKVWSIPSCPQGSCRRCLWEGIRLSRTGQGSRGYD